MLKIKICGLFREEDIEAANEARPDFIGFVFAESKRRVSPKQAAHLRARLVADVVPVGVFVNAAVAEVVALYKEGVIGVAQLHGQEDRDYVAALRKACVVPIIKAVRVDAKVKMADLFQYDYADYLLFDNGSGGTGRAFGWEIFSRRASHGFNGFRVPCFLAGGIGIGNIAKAIALHPYGLDISSGAETDGLKDKKKMLQLVKQVRDTFNFSR
ncbi:N-(5'-phosphoribosyl)anthranilate isomerase [Deferribacterales bacterium]|nr:N-(5'-phosphoribosyl)anthranilate isomerase [Deferribacterales bacterium]